MNGSIVVTGAARGIGRAIAERLAANPSFTVIGVDLAPELALAGDIVAVQVDLTSPRVLPAAPRVPELRAEFLGDSDQRVQLVLSDVSLGHTEDFYVRVFLDQPDADVTTSTDSPGFVGEFSFFGHAHDGHAPLGRYSLDATAALTRVGRGSGNPVVSLVLVPYAGRQPRTTRLDVGSIELTLARGSIED